MAEGLRRRTRLAAAAAVLAVLAALSGCAALPTSGPVSAGALPAEPREYRVAPVGPVPGARPEGIATGFLRAGVGAPDDFAAARSFLVTPLRTSWRPSARVVVHPGAGALVLTLAQGDRELTWDADPAPDPAGGPVEVRVSGPVVATVDEHGTYTPAAPGATEAMVLRLVVEDGQWRVADVPDQLLIDVSGFGLNWRPRPLFFPDASGTRLVPDVRWFADRSSTPATVVTELLRGPAPWLAPAVRPVAGPGARALSLASSTVPVEDHVAQVDLDASVLDADADARAVLRRQLEASLEGLPEVRSVRVTAEGGALSDGVGAEGPALVPAPAGPPVVLVGGVPSRWAGGRPAPLPDQEATLATTGALDAVALRGGAVAALTAGRASLLLWPPGEAPAPAVVLAAPAGGTLTPPSLDRAGYAWSTASTSDGTVTAVGPDGEVVAVSAPWLAGRTVLSVRASAEGARAVVASQAADGSDPRVDVAGLARDEDDRPVALTVAEGSPTPWLASVRAAVWVDESRVAVLGAPAAGSRVDGAAQGSGTQVFLVTGGEVRSLGAPPADSAGGAPELVGLAAGADARSLLLAASDPAGPRVFQRAGVRWDPVEQLDGATAPTYEG